MAASPRYIELLDDLIFDPEVSPTDLIACWKELLPDFTRITAPSALSHIAEDALALAAVRIGTPWSQALRDAKALHIAKNAGYAGLSKDPWANFRTSTSFGVTPYKGVLVRMGDKFIRFVNLQTNPALDQVDESITDTLRDLGAYALIARCIYEEDHHA